MHYHNSQLDIPKPELIAKLKSYISDAQSTPIAELCKAGDYKNQPDLRYPQTKGEYLVDSITFLLASQSWIDGEREPLLDNLLSVAGQLDKDINQPEAWQELFELAKEI